MKIEIDLTNGEDRNTDLANSVHRDTDLPDYEDRDTDLTTRENRIIIKETQALPTVKTETLPYQR